MTLNPDWKRILLRAWSIRWIAIAAVLSGLEVWFAFFTDRVPFGIPRGSFAAIAGLVSIAAFGARFIAQRKFNAS